MSAMLPEFPLLLRPADAFEASLHRLGLDREQLRGTLEVTWSRTLEPADVEGCGGVARELSTMSTDQYKGWIGILDRELDDGTFRPMEGTPQRSPEAYDAAISAGDGDAQEELRHVHGLYLVGDSRKVRGYRDVIEKHFAPLPARLYALDTLEIFPGATLDVAGYPVAFVARMLRIHPGASLRLLTMTRFTLEALEKR